MFFDNQSFKNHEKVVFAADEKLGLKAIIAIHSSKAGPAAGGTRFYNYQNDQDALHDVLRLSYGMSLKNIMAGLKIGGGKSIIMGDPKVIKTPELMRGFGKAINDLAGAYYCAEDVGTSVEDMEEVKKMTPYVAGLATGANASGDPSPFTALGVFSGIKASVEYHLEKESLKGLKIGVLGLGHVGYDLAEQLFEAGAELYVADINQVVLAKAEKELSAKIVTIDEIKLMELDVFAPCALGGIIDVNVAQNSNAKIIAGAANNQLTELHIGEILKARNILYAPDFVINAGGIINVEDEILGQYNRDANIQKAKNIANTLLDIYKNAREEDLPTALMAEQIALSKLDAL